MNNKLENTIGFVIILLILLFGGAFLGTQMLLFRLIAGIGFGYALTRGFMGFAGSVNRPYRTGSSKLMRILMWMFLGTAALSIALLYGVDATSYDLWVKPINLGLILGGLFFGFGMTFSSCCASGVLTDLVTGLPRAFITLIFFGIGAFIGFPVQKTADWVTKSWFSTVTGEQLRGGVYFPDLFKWDGLSGYLGAIILTALLASVIAYFAKRYEDRQKAKGTFTGVDTEIEQDKKSEDDTDKPLKLFSGETYNILFVKPWKMSTGAIVIAFIFLLLMGITKAGWGASAIYGYWFGKILMLFGISADALASFTHYSASFFETSIFANPVSVQNIGIIIGTLITLLLAGSFKTTFFTEIKINPKEIILFAMGGLFMGFGTRLANGCNVGALYTPIANFSLSGWVFLIFLVAGGIVGNKVAKTTSKWCVN